MKLKNQLQGSLVLFSLGLAISSSQYARASGTESNAGGASEARDSAKDDKREEEREDRRERKRRKKANQKTTAGESKNAVDSGTEKSPE